MSALGCVRCMTFFLLVLAVGAKNPNAVKGYKLAMTKADSETAVRFFYFPGKFIDPLIFRSVGSDDPRMNTVALGGPGRQVYVSVSEMDRLINALSSSPLDWQNSRQKKPFIEATEIIPQTLNLSVDVLFSKGSAASGIDPKNICDVLPPMDSAFTSDHARWEFQMFRINYGCPVPKGLNPKAYSYNFREMHN